MSRAKLKKAPLKEVIFELHWELPPVGTIAADPGYELAKGSFAQAIKKEYPIRKKILPEGIRISYKAEFQFWKGELRYPVVQIGPGLLTVNDTDTNYSWENNFKENILYATGHLEEVSDNIALKKIVLQYINGVEYGGADVKEFISKNLLTSIPRGKDLPGQTTGLILTETLEQQDGSKLSVSIQTGIENATGKPNLVWIITVEKDIADFSQLSEVLDSAHQLTSDTFVSMLEPSFYGSFDN
jgi:uncharacterized protein (TIGR04255 family)